MQETDFDRVYDVLGCSGTGTDGREEHDPGGYAIRDRGEWDRLSVRDCVMYAAFAATGLGCALPGALLPTLLVEWRLDDGQAGALFFLAFIGSSLGALTIRNVLKVSILAGSLLLVGSMAGLAFATQGLIRPLMLVYGLGLGTTMTSISLLRQRQRAATRSVELVRLNLMWAVGACVCPVLMTRALESGNARGVMLSLAVFFAAFFVVTLVFESAEERLSQRDGFSFEAALAIRRVPLVLIVMVMLVTGIEAAGGAWLASYAQRAQQGLAETVAAPTCMWAGLFCSRLVGSLSRAEEWLRRGFLGLLLAVAGATIGLVAYGHGTPLLGSAFLLGFGLGPLYPILLARVMVFREATSIFFLAGVSAAVLPWLTGVTSSRLHSLQAGLTVPAVSGLMLLGLGLVWELRAKTTAESMQ
jgi:fucose permease